MNTAVILSGGVGTRMGGTIPKQYFEVSGKPIISYSVETFVKRKDIDALVIVIAEEWKEYLESHLPLMHQPIFYASPGKTRQHSIYNALKVIETIHQSPNDVVIIHDAARPLVTKNIIDECILGCEFYDGVLPVLDVKDTIYYSKNGEEIDELLCRDNLYAGQAPEAFVFEKYFEIHNQCSDEEISSVRGSSELAHKFGLKIKLVSGDEINFKITTKEDLVKFKNIVSNEGKCIEGC